ncbi:MAG: 50S ribosomal protein L35 [Candidatus Aerophobetes bacterium]|nr:50S ribosomal protein L35 [Candidatus Aerophobetes bacterium]
MPKIKSHKGSMKRFKVTKKRKITRSKAYSGHLKVEKSSKRKRGLRKSTLAAKSDTKRIKRLIPCNL